jgi:two-component system OmpR family sensor kinase
MGRLFWKFFLFIWLAQLAGIVAVALLFWLTEQRLNRQPESVDAGPGARSYVGAAAAVLRYGGMDAFRSWASHDTEPPVYAVDSSGADLLGRAVAPAVTAEARELHEADPGSPLVIEVTDAQRHEVLLFAARVDRQGPGGPPPGPPHGRPPHAGPHNWPPRGPMTATLLASLLTAALLAWYVAKPIRSLRRAFEAASSGRLDHRIAPVMGTRQDELADLGREFDRMAERLQDSMSRQRRLLHDVSHEVRSPLARLQAAVGLLRQKASVQDGTIDRIEEEIARIDRLVGDLLKLSRIEAGELAEDAEAIDLLELVSEVICDADFEAQTAGRRIAWTLKAGASLVGRPEMLHVAFENILRNALKHAPQSETVTVETVLDDAGSRYLFRVLDSGPGVPEDELGRLFTPFFRTDRASSTEGYGLGLAIARRSIEAHGGTIRAQNRPAGGLSVEIALPLHAPGERAAASRPSG